MARNLTSEEAKELRANRTKERGPGKFTGLKEHFLHVFKEREKDPKTSLAAFAEKYPRDFYAIVAKIIPIEIVGQVDIDTTLTIRREIVMRQENLNGNGQLPVHAAAG